MKLCVFIYRNLRRRCWSVRSASGPDRGRVIGHAEALCLLDARPRVSQAGRRRVLSERQKNVHAGLVGRLVGADSGSSLADECGLIDANLRLAASAAGRPVTYNPYRYETFVDKKTEAAFADACLVLFDERGHLHALGFNQASTRGLRLAA